MAENTPFIIAVVDDDAAIRRLVRLFLNRAGFETFECTTGEEARQALTTRPWDLAILDRRLPDMDGVVLCQELKSNPAFDDIEFGIAMKHMYNHLNTAWNSRNADPHDTATCSDEDFDAWRAFPADISMD